MTEEESSKFTTKRRSIGSDGELKWGGDDGEQWSEAVESSEGVTVTDDGTISTVSDTPDNAVYTGVIDDDTTHRYLTASGDTLYSTDIESDDFVDSFDEYSIDVDVTVNGSNQSGSGRYPALGFKLTNAEGDELFSYSNVGEWVNTSGDRYDGPNNTVERIIVIDGSVVYSFRGETIFQSKSVEFIPPITVEITSVDAGRSGGGSSSDAVYSCDATIELTGRLIE